MQLELQPGTVFARDFRVINRLAEGGMGAVYLVEQISTSRQRALKVMHPQMVANVKHRERFAMEARIASRIESDHVVEIVGAGVDEASGIPWLAMELLRGRTLASLVQERGPLAPHDVAEVARQLGHALGQAHGLGLVHRDLKPENVFMAVPRRRDVPFTVKVLDFGISKWIQEARNATQNSQIIGSPFWMAPEQLEQGGSLTPATDVWALGLIFFQMLTGKMYWTTANADSPSINALIVELVIHPLAPASQRAEALGVHGKVPAGFDAWFARCVARPVAERFPTATDALDALLAILAPPAAPRFDLGGTMPLPSDALIEVSPARASNPPPPSPAASGIPPTRQSTLPPRELISAAPPEPVHAATIPSTPPPAPDRGMNWTAVLAEQLASTEDPRRKGEIALRVARVLEMHASGHDRAIETYRQVLGYDRTNLEAYRGLAALLRLHERWVELAELLATQASACAESMSSRDAIECWTALADVQEKRLNDAEAASRSWAAAHKLVPGDVRVARATANALGRVQRWDTAADALEEALQAINGRNERDAEFELWHELGVIYRDRIGQPQRALQAFERASQLKPADSGEQRALAAMYAVVGRLDDATARWLGAVESDPRGADAYTSLFELYQSARSFDRAFCVAHAAASVMGDAAPAALREFAATHRPRVPATVQGHLPEETLAADLCAPGLEPAVGKLFAAALGPLRRAVVKSPAESALQDRERLDPMLSSGALLRAAMPVNRAMLVAAAAFDVPSAPSLYYRAANPGALAHLPTEPWATLLGSGLAGVPAGAELNFVAARHVLYYRPEFYPRVLFGAGEALRAAVDALLAAIRGESSASGPKVAVDAGARAKLAGLVAGAEGWDLSAWRRAVDLTAVRAGVLLSGEIAALPKLLPLRDATLGDAVSDDEAFRHACAFAVSESYFRLRETLGIALRTPPGY